MTKVARHGGRGGGYDFIRSGAIEGSITIQRDDGSMKRIRRCDGD
jgi:hypothetical protein